MKNARDNAMGASPEMINVVPVAGKATASNGHIGTLLVDSGKIIAQDAEQILRYAKQHGLRFGEAAIRMGLVTQADIDRAVARQFEYTYLLPGESAVAPEVIAAYQPFSRQVEGLRAVRSQLLLRWLDDKPEHRRVAIVSSKHGDGRSYLAANLAVVFSQLGERTLLVDADLRNPKQHKLYGISNAVGLSTVLSGRAGLDTAQRIPAFAALSVLPSGPLAPNPQELLIRSAFPAFLEEAARHFDVVLLDTSAALNSADAHIVAARVRGAVVVSRLGRTRLSHVKELNDELTRAGVRVIGAVLNEH